MIAASFMRHARARAVETVIEFHAKRLGIAARKAHEIATAAAHRVRRNGESAASVIADVIHDLRITVGPSYVQRVPRMQWDMPPTITAPMPDTRELIETRGLLETRDRYIAQSSNRKKRSTVVPFDPHHIRRKK